MKVPLVILILLILGLGSLSTTSCLVTRKSERYLCNNNNDCEAGRTCDNGYCVQGTCPSQCSSCDSNMGCKIDCDSNTTCASVHCPAGYDCTIRCTDPNACGPIDCAEGKSCEIHCSRPFSCGAINCGAAPCDISCNASSSCPSIDCANSCKCDVSCGNPSNECPNIACPMRGGGFCTDGNMGNLPCDSSANPACDSCMM